MRSAHASVLFAVATLVLLPVIAWSDTVETQNIFEAGEKARAAEVNENFTAVKAAVDGNDALISDLQDRSDDLESEVGVAIPGHLSELDVSIVTVQGDIDTLEENRDSIDARVTSLENSPAPSIIAATVLIDAIGSPIAVPVNIGDVYNSSNFYGFTFQGHAYHFPVERFENADGDYDLFFQRNYYNGWLYFESSDCSGDAYYAETNSGPLYGVAPDGATGGSIPVHVSRMAGSSTAKTLILGGELVRLDFRKWMSLDGNGGCQGFGRTSVNINARRVVRLVDVPTEMPEPLGLVPGLDWGE